MMNFFVVPFKNYNQEEEEVCVGSLFHRRVKEAICIYICLSITLNYYIL